MKGIKIHIHKWKPGHVENREDWVACEEPLQILLNGDQISITMRTPGDDPALSIGFLYTEGIIHHFNQVQQITEDQENTIDVILEKNSADKSTEGLQRHFFANSSCGVCGKTSVDQIYQKLHYPIPKTNYKVTPEVLTILQDKLLNVQTAFQATGGIHAAVLFTPSGDYVYHSEDVGRHNALDKLIGHSLMADKIPLFQHILLLSGRASFELIQKAAMAGISFVCAVGAPSTLAVQLANDMNITLVGFLKKQSFNVYTHPERVL